MSEARRGWLKDSGTKDIFGMGKTIELFVPGRLCLFGEHSDWAGMYRSTNSALCKGQAVVTGIEQGIYAVCEKCEEFIVRSDLEFYKGEELRSEMDSEKLLSIASEGGFFSYVAGVASYINDNYSVGGVKISVTRMDLPLKSGLSSSAAVCVLVARAFNRLYNLKMNVQGEMQAAFRGEQRTPSRCGRLDQACAYGVKPVLMGFDGVEISSHPLRVGTTFYWVIANLMASKDTIKILADLNKCYPFAENDLDRSVQEALGPDNLRINSEVIKALSEGDALKVGELMDEAQDVFDKKVAPACTELKAPVLHSVLSDPEVRKLVFGGKGVGSQGDGTVQFLAKSDTDAGKLCEYLEKKRGMPAFRLTLKPGQQIRKAIVPLAGFGTRVFPATKSVKKCFLPVPDRDGLLKPAILILLEELIDSGIEEIALIIGEEDRAEFDAFFTPLSSEHMSKLPDEKRSMEDRIEELGKHITYIIQKERLGFGHAVYLARDFVKDDPVLLTLGDFLYKSHNDVNPTRQVMDAFYETGKLLIALMEVPSDKVVHYGIVHGVWDNEEENILKADSMVEKPTNDYASEYLGVMNSRKEKKYYATFGEYVLTPEVFSELDRVIKNGSPTEGREFGLTAVLDTVREKYGMNGFLPDAECFDIGLPEEYVRTVTEFGRPHA